MVKEWLKKELDKENLYKRVKLWEELEDCRQKNNETIAEFVDRFERCYERVAASSETAKIPEEIRAFMVLEKADVSDTQRLLILSKTNHEEKTTMFSNM